MIYGYARTSTREQNEARQMVNFAEHNIPEENIYLDKQTGANFERTAYKKLISVLKEDDVVFIHAIDRLGRNYDEIIKQWQIITKEIKADIVVLDMPLLDTRARNNDLTGKFIADMVLQVLSYVAQKEREAIKTRQKEGIKIAKEQGKFDKVKLDKAELIKLKKRVDAKDITVTDAARQLNITRATWYARTRNIG